MQLHTHTTKAQPRHQRARPFHAPRRPNATAPLSTGLTRAQLRAIVIEQLG